MLHRALNLQEPQPFATSPNEGRYLNKLFCYLYYVEMAEGLCGLTYNKAPTVDVEMPLVL